MWTVLRKTGVFRWPLLGTLVYLLTATGCQPPPASQPARPQPAQSRSQPRPQQPRPGQPSTGKPAAPSRPVMPPLTDTWPPRAVWVPREIYKSPRQIAALMEAVRQAGLNTVLFQVRGHATAYYYSSIEPFAYEFPQGGPGFDPLAVACREAHMRGLAIHAWINIMPGWAGDQPPADGNHIYHKHPEWFWYDQKGRRQPLSGWYVSVNPCLPEVRSYLVSICREIVTRYPVDGLHLDYIRFPTDKSPRGSDYPCDARTLELYRQATGLRPWSNRMAWADWRTHQVTSLVWEIHSMIKRERPQVLLTASCPADLATARKESFQDGPLWLRSGYLDGVFLMNYTSSAKTFRSRQETWQREAGGRRVAAGIGLFVHNSDSVSLEQLKMARQWDGGFAFFSSPYLFSGWETSKRRLAGLKPTLLEMKATAAKTPRKPVAPPTRTGASPGRVP
jgi:uncharacterized lipoprotein YddW (UPF0748 family)